MNRDEILNMSAGREMDALVAEKVMGWTTIRERTYKHSSGIKGSRPYNVKEIVGKDPNQRLGGDAILSYSENISDAWLVVEKLDLKWRAENDLGYDGSISFGFYLGAELYKNFCWAEGETLPHAICLAALLLVTK